MYHRASAATNTKHNGAAAFSEASCFCFSKTYWPPTSSGGPVCPGRPCQYLYFCPSNASNVSTCVAAVAAVADADVLASSGGCGCVCCVAPTYTPRTSRKREEFQKAQGSRQETVTLAAGSTARQYLFFYTRKASKLSTCRLKRSLAQPRAGAGE